jgi:hypothetical protein
MTWLPSIVLFGSSVFPLGYYLTSSERNHVGRTGTISVIIPVIGLIFGIVLVLGSLGSLIANPVRFVVSVLGILELLVVLGFLVPRVIGATVGECIVNTLFE